jgi:segregation and condensation protein A
VKKFTIITPQYEGPFHVILNLIEEKKLEVTSLSLLSIAEQFFAYIKEHEEMPLFELADFLFIASRLLYLKSRTLNAQWSHVDDEMESVSLEKRLLLYQSFVEASKQVEEKLLGDGQSFATSIKAPSLLVWEMPTLSKDVLHEAMKRIQDKLDAAKELPIVTARRVVSIKEKIENLRALLQEKKNVLFSEVLEGGEKEDVIASFLAMLEMVKQREIVVNQEMLGDDMNIMRI